MTPPRHVHSQSPEPVTKPGIGQTVWVGQTGGAGLWWGERRSRLSTALFSCAPGRAFSPVYQPFSGSVDLMNTSCPPADRLGGTIGTQSPFCAYGPRPSTYRGDSECRSSSASSRRTPQRPLSACGSASNAACPWPITRTGARSCVVRSRWSEGSRRRSNPGSRPPLTLRALEHERIADHGGRHLVAVGRRDRVPLTIPPDPVAGERDHRHAIYQIDRRPADQRVKWSSAAEPSEPA